VTTSAEPTTLFEERPSRDEMESWKEYLVGPRRESDTPATRTLRMLDLFSGVGGLALGFARAAEERGADVRSLGAADTDAGALRVYERNFGTEHAVTGSVRALVDYAVRGEGESARFLYPPELTRMAPRDFEAIDVVLAGPPCQGHSSLNNRTRGDDERNRLYLTVPALAVATGAEVVVIENVPGVVHARENVVLTTTKLLGDAGYSLTSGVLAADRLGWPQTRKRFFLVASRLASTVPIAELALALRRAPRPVSWAIGDLLDHAGDPMDHVAELSSENAERIAWLFANDAYDTPLHLRPACHREGTSYGAVYGRMRWDAPAPTLSTGFLTPGRGRFIHPKRPRTITPREAARIQGIPDWFDFAGPNEEFPARRDLGKWIGNAVPTVLGYVAAMSALGLRRSPAL
jgi:DNA (cytosine-5)-methyltransferase 1